VKRPEHATTLIRVHPGTKGVLYRWLGILPSPMAAGSISVVANALRLRPVKV